MAAERGLLVRLENLGCRLIHLLLPFELATAVGLEGADHVGKPGEKKPVRERRLRRQIMSVRLYSTGSEYCLCIVKSVTNFWCQRRTQYGLLFSIRKRRSVSLLDGTGRRVKNRNTERK